MTYRMKRNGAGLASICLLATSVLVIMSAGISLIVGINDVFRQRYPTDFSLEIGSYSQLTEEQEQTLRNFASEGLSVENENTRTYLYAMGILEDDSLQFSNIYEENRSLSGYWDVYILDLAEYNRLSGSTATLLDATKQSSLKKLEDAKLRRDYEAAVTLLDRIPPEIVNAYARMPAGRRGKANEEVL